MNMEEEAKHEENNTDHFVVSCLSELHNYCICRRGE